VTVKPRKPVESAAPSASSALTCEGAPDTAAPPEPAAPSESTPTETVVSYQEAFLAVLIGQNPDPRRAARAILESFHLTLKSPR
jgi:hypothetical protein